MKSFLESRLKTDYDLQLSAGASVRSLDLLQNKDRIPRAHCRRNPY